MEANFSHNIIVFFLYFAIGLVLLTFGVWLINRILFFNSLRGKLEKKQTGFLTTPTKYTCCDFFELECNSQIKNHDSLVIVVPDFFEPLFIYDDFLNFLSTNKPTDYFIYRQRQVLANNNEQWIIGNYMQDLLDILNYFKNKNIYKQITIITSGLIANLVLAIANKKYIDKLIVVNYENKGFSYTHKYTFKLFVDTIFSKYGLIPYYINETNLSDNKEFDKKIIENNIESGFFSVAMYHQMLKAIRTFYRNLKKSDIELFFKNSKKNSNLNAKKFAKILALTKCNYEVEVFNEATKFILNDGEKLTAFESIISII